MSVVLDHHAAAAGGDDDRRRVALDVRPPGIDVALDDRQGPRLAAQVIRQRATAAARRDAHQRDPDAVEHARERRVDAGRQRALDAAVEREHLARMPRRAARCRDAGASGILLREARGKQRPQRATERECSAEQRPRQEALADQPALRARGERARSATVDDLPPDVEQPSILDAGRTRRLAAAAGEAPVEVQSRALGDLASLERLLDQVDASARTVQLVAQQLIRRARRRAESAVDARAQDRVGLAAFGRVANEVGERGLHASVPAGPPQGHCAPPRGAANTVSVGAVNLPAGPPQGHCAPPRGAANAVSVGAVNLPAGPPQGH